MNRAGGAGPEVSGQRDEVQEQWRQTGKPFYIARDWINCILAILIPI